MTDHCNSEIKDNNRNKENYSSETMNNNKSENIEPIANLKSIKKKDIIDLRSNYSLTKGGLINNSEICETNKSNHHVDDNIKLYNAQDNEDKKEYIDITDSLVSGRSAKDKNEGIVIEGMIIEDNQCQKDFEDDNISKNEIKDNNNILVNNTNNGVSRSNTNNMMEEIDISIENIHNSNVIKEVIDVKDAEIEDEQNCKETSEEESDSSEDKSSEPIIESINLKSLSEIYIKEYLIQNETNTITPKTIDFLFDYCSDLLEKGYYDQRIINWIIENKSSLDEKGLDEKSLMFICKQQKYYSSDNVLNSMTYRLSKFGKLANGNEIARKLNKDDNEDNFKFYQEDSFLYNEEEEEEVNDFSFLFSKSAHPGMMKEDRISYLINAHKKKRHEKNSKKILGKKRYKGKYPKSANRNSLGDDNKDRLEEITFNTIDELIQKRKDRRRYINHNGRNKFIMIKELIKHKKKNNNKVSDDEIKKIAEFIESTYDIIKVSSLNHNIIIYYYIALFSIYYY